MRKDQVLSLAGFLMALAALISNHSMTRVEQVQPHRLPVETFPHTIQDWTAGPDRSVDAEVVQRLAAAKIVDRIYTNGVGQAVELMLISSDRSDDLHNPKICFPNQGWILSNERDIQLRSVTASFMTAASDTEKLDVLYWLTAKTGESKVETLPKKLQIIRAHFVGVEGPGLINGVEGDSLLVRLVTVHNETSLKTLLEFASQIQGPLQQLQKAAPTTEGTART